MQESNSRTFTASEAIPANRLVKLDAAATVSVADVSTTAIGVSPDTPTASGDELSVRLLNSGGTIDMVCEAAVTLGSTVYGRNLGMVDDSSADSAVAVGKALQAGSGANSIIEVLPN